MATLILANTTPIRGFAANRVVTAVTTLQDERMVTASDDGILCLWDLKTGSVLRQMGGHRSRVSALTVSPDGKWIASGDESGELIIWDGKTGELLNQVVKFKAHDDRMYSRYSGGAFNQTVHKQRRISSLDFSSDSMALACGSSSDTTTELWSTSTWKVQQSISCDGYHVRCVRYSPSIPDHCEAILAIATNCGVHIYRCHTSNSYHRYDNPPSTASIGRTCSSLSWTRDGSRLLLSDFGCTIQEWDTSTWQQVGDPWKGHFGQIRAISLDSSGTLLVSASDDYSVRLWRRSDQRTIAIFKHSGEVKSVMFSADDKHILSGGADTKISEWPISEDTLPEDGPRDGLKDGPKDDLMKEQATHQAQAYSDFKILDMNPTVRNACIAGDWPTAEEVLNRDIDTNANHIAYANRAFVMARKCNWDKALQDAIRSVSIQPSLAGHISKAIAFCGKRQVVAARMSFDLASIFTNGDLMTDHFLFLIKAIALFNANEHQEAMSRIGELAACPNINPVACRIVEAYLRVQLGNIALDGARYNEAVEHFTSAVNASTFFYKLPIHSTYDEFIALFGWDLKSLWLTANQQQCYALFRAGSSGAAMESYQSVMDKADEDVKADLRAWFTALT